MREPGCLEVEIENAGCHELESHLHGCMQAVGEDTGNFKPRMSSLQISSPIRDRASIGRLLRVIVLRSDRAGESSPSPRPRAFGLLQHGMVIKGSALIQTVIRMSAHLPRWLSVRSPWIGITGGARSGGGRERGWVVWRSDFAIT